MVAAPESHRALPLFKRTLSCVSYTALDGPGKEWQAPVATRPGDRASGRFNDNGFARRPPGRCLTRKKNGRGNRNRTDVVRLMRPDRKPTSTPLKGKKRKGKELAMNEGRTGRLLAPSLWQENGGRRMAPSQGPAS